MSPPPSFLRLRSITPRLVAGVIAVTPAGCDAAPTDPTQGPPSRLVIAGGLAQSAVVGTQLASPLEVRVLDDAGRPVRGQAVTFRVTSGGGSILTAATSSNDHGVALARWTLGTSASETQRAEARVDAGAAPPLLAEFQAIALPGAPAKVAAIKGMNQAGTAGAALAESLAVRVLDDYDNPIPEFPVAWTVADGGGTVASATSLTNAQGVAATRWTLGSVAGAAQQVVAAVASLAPVPFVASADAGTAAQLVLETAAAGAAAGERFQVAPAIRLADAFGNAVTGAADVVSMIASEGASVVGTASATPVAGIARFTDAGLTGAVGSYSITYSATLVGTRREVTQAIALAPGRPSRLVLATAAAGAAGGLPFATQPVVTIADLAGNVVPTASATVTIAIDSGASLLGTTSVHATAGTARFTDAGMSGPSATYALTYSAIVDGTARSITQPLVVSAGTPVRLVLRVPATVLQTGDSLTVLALLVDVHGAAVAVAGRAVKWTGYTSGPWSAISTTDSSGVASILYPGSTVAGGLTISAAADSISASVALNIMPGPGASLRFATQPGEAGWRVGQYGVRVEVMDRYGNPTRSWTDTVAMSLSVNTVGAVLSGTVTQPTKDGTALFPSLVVSETGSFTLIASSRGKESARSNPFLVTPVGRVSSMPGKGVSGIAVGDTMVYFGFLEASPTTGGGYTLNGDLDEPWFGVKAPSYISLEAQHANVLVNLLDGRGTGVVYRCNVMRFPLAAPRFGSVPRQVLFTSLDECDDLQSDGRYLYVTVQTQSWVSPYCNGIVRIDPVSASTLVILRTCGIAMARVPLAAAGGYLFYASEGTIYRVSRDGGTPVPLVEGTTVQALVVVGDVLYWSTPWEIRSIPIAGGTPTTRASVYGVDRLQRQGAYLYAWTVTGQGLMRYRLSDFASVNISLIAPVTRDFAVTDEAIYWVVDIVVSGYDAYNDPYTRRGNVVYKMANPP